MLDPEKQYSAGLCVCLICAQASLAAIGSASSAWLAYKEPGPTRKLNAASAILLASVIPFTVLVIKPTNDILRSEEPVSDAEVCYTSPPSCTPYLHCQREEPLH